MNHITSLVEPKLKKMTHLCSFCSFKHSSVNSEWYRWWVTLSLFHRDPCCISLPLPSIHKADIISLQWLQSILCSLSSGFLTLTLSENPFLILFLLCPVSRLPFSTAGIKNGGCIRRRFCSAIKLRSEVKNRLGLSVNSLRAAGCLDGATLKGASWGNRLRPPHAAPWDVGTSCLLAPVATPALRWTTVSACDWWRCLCVVFTLQRYSFDNYP